MRKFGTSSVAVLFALLFALLAPGFTASTPARAAGPATVNLGTAANFSILAKTKVTDVPSSSVVGNVGLSPAAGSNIASLSCSEVTGKIYDVNGAYTGGSDANTSCLMAGPGANKDLVDIAVGDMDTAFTQAYGATLPSVATEVGAGTIGLATPAFTPGIYKWSTDVDITGNITLSGSASDVWIFQIAGDLVVDSKGTLPLGVKVLLTGGAKASNVFWAIAGSNFGAVIGTYATFNGSLLSSKQVILQTGAVLNGRALADTQVVLDHNAITIPSAITTLTVTKIVNNNYGGSKVVSDFPLFIDGQSVASGAASTTTSGLHTVSETSSAGYTSVIGGDCAPGGTVTLATGDALTCTITNSDIAPQLIVTKIVVGGSKVVSDFPLFIDGQSVASGAASTTTTGLHTVSETSDPGYTSVIAGNCASDGTITLALGEIKTCTITNTFTIPTSGGTGFTFAPVPPLIDVVKVPSPLALPGGPGPVKYTYTLRNIGTVPVSNITMVGDSCSPIVLVSGDTNGDSKLEVNETWVYTCSTTLLATHTNVVTATGWANGINAVDVASATVVVGGPAVPPLIHVTKVPSVMTLSALGGTVTYTNLVTNPGKVPLANVKLVDDKCGPVNYFSGDVNGNSLLDPSETWVFTCKSNLAQTTTNTVTATGWADGFMASDFAIATVVVADPGLGIKAPGLPNAGLPPQGGNITLGIILLSGIFLSALSLYAIIKNRQRGRIITHNLFNK